MRPLFSGVIYCLLGTLFTYFAIQQVNSNGWSFFAYMLIFLATIDYGSGFRLILLHFKIKSKLK
ncbi:YdiK family protein [Heyndrickxia sp. NPDC080065]|uniref:YdiK family protein n=1 Tax=Heyndrickxia sp. NPDC080065 TaxID=3390568 RepID=UPI003CFDF855